MSEDITIVGELERLLDSSSFQTFVMVTASGDRDPISRKRQVAISKSVAVVLPPVATSVFIRLNQIVAIESSVAA